jgi:transcriptional regulator with XRE-family HTH domain
MHVMNEPDERAPVNIPTPEQLVGRQLRLLRQGRGWSQQEVAEKMRPFGYEWSQATVTRLESATRPIRLNELADLALLYGVPMEQFLEPEVQDFAWDDLDALDREIKRLTAEREGMQAQIEKAESAARASARITAQAVIYRGRLDSRLEALKRWRPQGAAEDGEGQ